MDVHEHVHPRIQCTSTCTQAGCTGRHLQRADLLLHALKRGHGISRVHPGEHVVDLNDGGERWLAFYCLWQMHVNAPPRGGGDSAKKKPEWAGGDPIALP